jgi:aspartyl-tRNA(Asn)/glutamyl-tRNA(Gln) amidotransferase subunit A
MRTQEKLKKYLEKIKKHNKEINAFLQIRDEKELLNEAREIDEKIKKGNAGRLAGKIIGVKANINVFGMNISCASKTLENYKAPYDAEVIRRIKKQDGLIIGITNMDEFACGGSGETSAFGPTKNPVVLDLITGGSSSGSVAAVAADFCDMTLGTDTGGSIRNPASHCGVVGIKPTYSSVSRYGLIDLSMSLDQIGPIAKNIDDAFLLLSVISGKDEKDTISQENTIKLNNSIPKKIKIGLLDVGFSNEISKLIEKKVGDVVKKHNWEMKVVKIPYIDLSIEAYYPLVYVEFFSGTRKFDGRRYGKKIEDVAGPEVLRRILGGSEITKAEHKGRYYHKALMIKELISREMSKVFKDVDCIISPTVPRLPHKIGEKISVSDMYSYDSLTSPSNLAGNCAITIPVGKIDNIPVGMQIMCDKFDEEKMFGISKGFEGI